MEGQKTYHADLEKAARAYIQDHEQDFKDERVNTKTSPAKNGSSSSSSSNKTTGSAAQSANANSSPEDWLSSLGIGSSRGILLVTAISLVFVLLITNFWTLVAMRRHARAAHEARLGHPREVANAVTRVLADFNRVHEKVNARGRPVTDQMQHELESVTQAVHGLSQQLLEIVDRLTD